MAPLLTAASILVAVGAAVSLLLALPAVAPAETAGEANAAGRARAWLAALIFPPVVGIGAAVWALALLAQGTGASPHIGGARPHLCLVPLRNAPSGSFILRMLAWVALLLVVAALLRAIGGATSSHLLRRMMVTSGGTLREGCDAVVVDLGRPVSFTGGLLRPVVVVSASLVETLAESELAAILAHERAHARRRDNLKWLLAESCATLLAPIPTVWYFRANLRRAMEEAADDAALDEGVAAEALQGALSVAGGAAERRPRTPTLASLLIPAPAQHEQRAKRMKQIDIDTMSATRARGRFQAWLAAGIGLLVLAVLLLVARQAVEDSLFCAAEQLMRVVGG